MSLYGAEFIRNINDHLGVVGEPPIDVQYRPHGYLFLASEKGAQDMIENSKLQRELGAKNILLQPEKLKERFPWMNTDDVALGCLGVEKEGWFDPWSFLYALKRKCLSQGVYYVEAEVIGFLFNNLTASVYADPKDVSGELANDVIVSYIFLFCNIFLQISIDSIDIHLCNQMNIQEISFIELFLFA